jgi:hypothetical protein
MDEEDETNDEPIMPSKPGRCIDFALSFFDDLDAARRKLASLRDRLETEEADRRYGDYIGEVDLVEADGVMSEPVNAPRHFTLHPADGARFASRVVGYHAP